MSPIVRKAIYAVCLLAILGSLIAYASTGAYPYTRFRDAEIESANAQNDLSDLFADSDSDATPPPTEVESVNAIGLLPSGSGKDAISVFTIAVPALFVGGLVWWLGRRSASKQAKTVAQGAGPTN